jgi:hypothetical protein
MLYLSFALNRKESRSHSKGKQFTVSEMQASKCTFALGSCHSKKKIRLHGQIWEH